MNKLNYSCQDNNKTLKFNNHKTLKILNNLNRFYSNNNLNLMIHNKILYFKFNLI